MAGGRGKKRDKDKDGANKTCTSPRKQKSTTAAEEEEEERQRQRDELTEGDGAATATGDEVEEKTQALSSPFTAEQDEQIAAFFEEHKLFYDMADADHKNKKREHLLLEFARSLFTSSNCIFSFKYIFHKESLHQFFCKISRNF